MLTNEEMGNRLLTGVCLSVLVFMERHWFSTSRLAEIETSICAWNPIWAGIQRRTRGGKATSDLPQSQNSQRKAAGSCQATLSLSQQEVESNRALITFSSISQEAQTYNALVRRRSHTMFSHTGLYLNFLAFYSRSIKKGDVSSRYIYIINGTHLREFISY